MRTFPCSSIFLYDEGVGSRGLIWKAATGLESGIEGIERGVDRTRKKFRSWQRESNKKYETFVVFVFIFLEVAGHSTVGSDVR
jgi:hypothetical protein